MVPYHTQIYPDKISGCKSWYFDIIEKNVIFCVLKMKHSVHRGINPPPQKTPPPLGTTLMTVHMKNENLFESLNQNCKIACCYLKNMSYRTEILGDTKCQNLINFFEKRLIYRKRKAFVESIWHQRFFPEFF